MNGTPILRVIMVILFEKPSVVTNDFQGFQKYPHHNK